MSTNLGTFLGPISAEAEEPENWLILRLAVRALAVLPITAALVLAAVHAFVRSYLRPD